jgi:hypothetical protein
MFPSQTPPPFFVSLLIEAEIVVLEFGTQWTRATHRRARKQALPSRFTACDQEFNSLSFLPTAPGPKLI